MSIAPPPCRENPALFDSTDLWQHRVARRVCARCPIVNDCLTLALSIAGEHSAKNAAHRGPYGTWGGLLWDGGHVVPMTAYEAEGAAA